jgi:hypothetical protein
MKQTPDMDRIQAEMRPGAITQSGFLGTDRRKLADILIADEAAVMRLGLTHEAIASRLRELRAFAVKGLGLAVQAPPHFEVRLDGARGKLPCPFGHPGLYEKNFMLIRNLRLNEEILITDLNIHLIERHGFYEGEGSLYHVSPERLARVLELMP